MSARILDHPLLTSRAFFPRRTGVPEVFEVEVPGATLACYRAAPYDAPSALTVVHFHGNGEVVADYRPGFVELLLGMGVNLVLAEYRGYGGSTGKPSLGAVLEDAVAVLEALSLPPERVVVFGRSLGSYAAIELGARFALRGMIIESGIADPLERILMRVTADELGVEQGALEEEVGRYLDHEKKLGAYRGPLLVLHAVADDMVDPSHAVRILSWGRGEDRELVLLPRGGHNNILSANQARYVAAVRGFLGRLGG